MARPGVGTLPVSVKSASSSNSSEAGPGCWAFSSASLTSSSWTIASRSEEVVERVETVGR